MADKKVAVFGAATGSSIFELIRHKGPLSRAQLVRRTGLSKSTVSIQTERLLKMGLIREEAKTGRSGPGRRSVLRFAADQGVVVGVELGATSIDVAIADLDARVINAHSEPLEISAGPEPVLTRMCAIIENLLLAAEETISTPQNGSGTGRTHTLLGIGIGLPGPVDAEKGCVISPPIMPGWDRYPVRDRVSDRFGVPCVVDNDVNVMAIGEARVGIGKSQDNFLFVKIGTGIGCGIIINGRIYRGAQGSAGDIGHIAIDGETAHCPCGNQGCLEIVAGGAGIARRGQLLAEQGISESLHRMLDLPNRNGTPISAVEVGRAAAEGDGPAIELVVQSGRSIGTVLAKLVNFFNPEMIILGGGVTNLGDVFLAAIRERVIGRATALATAELKIRRSTHGAQSGMVGAAVMAVDAIFSAGEVTKMVRSFPG